MVVWVIGRNYPTPKNHMSGSFELEQAKMLSKNKNLKVSYLTLSLHPFRWMQDKKTNKRNEDNLSIFTSSSIFFPRIYPFYFNFLREKLWANFFNHVEKETGFPDVIHLHYPVMMMIADALRYYKEKGTKIILTEHWSKVQEEKIDKSEKIQLNKYAGISDKFICVGEPLKKAIIKMAKSDCNLEVVPNVIHNAFVPIYKKHECFEFVAVGRLVKIKQFDKIIEAFAKCFKNNENVKLTIIGSGDEFDFLKQLSNDLNVSNLVNFTGSLSRAETAKKVANADCLVCFSKFETFGVTIIEAWACGIPTILTTACSALNGYFNESLGLEISPADIDALSDSMKYIYENINNYDKKYISEFAKKRFSESAISKRLIEIYET